MMLDERLIRDAISKCGLSQSVPQVIEKTKEMLRIMNIKMPTGYLKKAEICRHLYAIEHACQALGLSFDKTKLQEQAPVTKKIYLEGLMSCSQIDTTAARQNLHVNLPSNQGLFLVLSRLAIHYGHDLQTAARHILMQYKKIYIDKLPENQQSLVNINSAVCQAAAFYVAGTKTKAKLHRGKVASMAGVNSEIFSNVVDSMITVMNSIASAGDNSSKAQNLPRQTHTTSSDFQIRNRRFQSACHSSSSSSGSSSSTSTSSNIQHFKKRSFDECVGDQDNNLKNDGDTCDIPRRSNIHEDKETCITAVHDEINGINYWQADDLPQSMSSTAASVSTTSRNTSSMPVRSNRMLPLEVRRIDHLEVRNRRSETVNPLISQLNDEREEYQAQREYDDRVRRLKRWKFEIWKAAHLKNWKLTLKPGEFGESDTE